jgi:hypothetical protein
MKIPLGTLIRRFFSFGVALVSISLTGLVTLVVGLHYHPGSLSQADTASITSFLISATIVGIMLTAAPLISPFLTTSPRPQLPTAEEEQREITLDFEGNLNFKSSLEEEEFLSVPLPRGELRNA